MEQDKPLNTLSDVDIDGAVTAQKEMIALFEREFVPMRKRYERLRGRLRELEGERERRRLAASGQGEAFKPVPRRAVTVADAVAGRERTLGPDAPLETFAFMSMRRQPVVLNREGDRARQRLTFYRDPAGRGHAGQQETAEAATFGEARRLADAGWVPGVPGVALNRLAVYYLDTAAAGWLRLDQMYVEEL